MKENSPTEEKAFSWWGLAEIEMTLEEKRRIESFFTIQQIKKKSKFVRSTENYKANPFTMF